MLAHQLIIVDLRQGVEIIAAFKNLPRMRSQQLARIVTIGVIRDKRCTPLKGAHQPVFIALREMAFARAYQASEQDSSAASQKRFGRSRESKSPPAIIL